MEKRGPSVLLIAESPQGCSYLARRLERDGCACGFATSLESACQALSREKFDLVLSQMRLRDETLYPLIGLLDGSRITLFYSHPVEDGCWWLPALRHGRDCFGSAALRASEFMGQLGELIEELRLDTIAAPPRTTRQDDRSKMAEAAVSA
jgi:CheY-like chemotaxis protein